MTAAEIARLRLRRQHLTGPPLPTPEAVVHWLGAVQSQELGPAKWSLARRARGQVTEADVDRALAEGRILRTHLLRPTWHFVLPADIRWMIQLTGPRVSVMTGSYERKLGLTAPVVARSQRLLAGALAGGRHLTRDEIFALFARDRVLSDRTRLGLVMIRAELDMVVCSGAPRAGKQTYALFDERVPPAPALSREQALAELTARYFSSHGPATLRDFLWWGSLTAAEGRRALELCQGRLQRLELEGRTYWMADPPARAPRPSPAATVHLLQGFDEVLVAYTESKPIAAATGFPAIPAGQRMFLHAIARDGRLAGAWRRLPGTGPVTVEARLRRRLDPAAREALQEELARYGRFLRKPVRLQLVPAKRLSL